MIKEIFPEKIIQLIAGNKPFTKGKQLLQQGAVIDLQTAGNKYQAKVMGQHLYTVELIISGGDIRGHCSCPASSYQDFCKHCVATALMVNSGQTTIETVASDAKNNDHTSPSPNTYGNSTALEAKTSDSNVSFSSELEQYLSECTPEELRHLLMDCILGNPLEREKWELKLITRNQRLPASEVKKQITQALPLDDLWDWREVEDYFNRAEQAFQTLQPCIENYTPDDQWKLALYSIKRFNKVLQYIDDSGGFRFELEVLIYDQLTKAFTKLEWSSKKKANWLLKQIDSSEYDLFPAVPDAFETDTETKKIFLSLCQNKLSELQTVKASQPDGRLHWQLKSYAAPLIREAQNEDNWKKECELIELTACHSSDLLEACEICLKNKEPFAAEDWFIRAKRLPNGVHCKQALYATELKVHVALDRFADAWNLAWNNFTAHPSSWTAKQLQELEAEIGQQDPNWLRKVEETYIQLYHQKKGYKQLGLASDLIELYLDQNNISAAIEWSDRERIDIALLEKVAQQAMAEYPAEGLGLFERIIKFLVAQTNNDAYKKATLVLLQTETHLQEHPEHQKTFQGLIQTLSQEFKAKRNMMALIREHFDSYL